MSPKWSFPRSAPVSDSPVPQPSAPGHRPRAVLVVGDDRASREGLRAALEGDGHAVETAADVWHALARTRDRDFDVVVVSAEVDRLLQRDADALRIAELLEKPINPHELRAIVRGLQT